MAHQDPRQLLDRLIRDRGDDYAGLSRLIGRNSAYIQQFIKRGTPRKLDEADRARIAEYFGIPDRWLLHGHDDDALVSKENSYRPRPDARPSAPAPTPVPPPVPMPANDLVLVPRYAIRASAGPGAVPGDETPSGHLGFTAQWLRQATRSSPGKLTMIEVEGDSMFPTLVDGDDIMVDQGDGPDRLRDGIYVLRVDDVLMVKRLACNPATGRFDVRSDNPAYPVWPDCHVADIHIIGRVIWSGRKVG